MYLNILSYRNNEKIWWRIANCGDCFHVVTLHDCSVIFIIKIPMLWWICIFWTIGGVLPVEACSFDVKVILYVKLDRFALLVPVSVLVSLTVCGVCKRMQHLYGFDLLRLLVRMARMSVCSFLVSDHIVHKPHAFLLLPMLFTLLFAFVPTGKQLPTSLFRLYTIVLSLLCCFCIVEPSIS